MRLRNDRVLGLLGFFLFILFVGITVQGIAAPQDSTAPSTNGGAPPAPATTGSGQAAPPAVQQSVPPQNGTSSQTQPPTGNPPQTGTAPQAGTPPTPAPQQPPQSQGETPQNQTPQNQTPPDQQNQAPSDSGIFVFKKEVDEVVLHASVMDTKNNRMVMD